MSFELSKIIAHMGLFAMLIAGTLVIMALLSLAVFFERIYVFRRSEKTSKRFAGVATGLLAKEAHQEFLVQAQAHHKSHLSRLLQAGMTAFLKAQSQPGKMSSVELTRRELLRSTEALNADVRRGMGLLASVGSVAPFVGLLGTVVGIIDAFQGIAREGSGGLGAVSAGIAEALVVTALGLLVAIPAVLAFNFLTAQSEKLMLGLEQARGEFIDYLESRFGQQAGMSRTHSVEIPVVSKEAVDVRS